MLHKPSKPAKYPTSYRPISLLNSLSKLFEKVIHSRMSKFIELKKLYPNYQFGFRENLCTTYQICRLNEIITKSFEEKSFTLVAFLDFEQAFDKVWHEGLLEKLASHNFPSYIQNQIQSYLKDRQFQVRVNSALSSPRKISAGVPQGSVLAPLLFNLYVADMPQMEGSELAMFADDTAIIVKHQHVETARNILQRACDQLSSWLVRWKIHLNVDKTVCKIFTLRRKYIDPQQIEIYNSAIPWNPCRETVKYLGVELDKKLTWKAHIIKKNKRSPPKTRHPLPTDQQKIQVKN